MKSFDCGLCNELLVFSGQNIFSEFLILIEELMDKLGYSLVLRLWLYNSAYSLCVFFG